MITREFDLTIRVPQQDYIDTGIKLVQNDQGVYVFNLRITDGITEIDYSQVSSATITFALANGTVVQSDPERLAISSGGITYEMGTSEISCPGKVTASIQLFGEEGERLTTARFRFEVVADLITPGAVQSESHFPLLQQLVADVEQLKQDIVDLQIPDGSIMDVKLSDAAGQIKQRFASHMAEITNQLSDIEGYIGYTADDIYGVEVDYENRTFTRLAGAVGKTAGADFDSILAFGGRRRCNLADNGTVNAYYGDPGYIEDGSNGQVMVEQPKFYYKVVPLKMEKNDEVEIASVKFDTGASADGNITITLNGVAFNVAVANGDTATAVAGKVRGTTFAGWTTGGSGATVTFTATKVGARSATTFTDTGTTGVTATVTRTQVGYIGKGFKLRKARYYVSMTKKAGFKVHPAFVKNGVEKEKIYLSAFEGSLYDVSASAYILDDAQIADFTASTGDKLSSIANAKPISGLTQDLTRRKCGILAENRGTGWSQQYAATAACSQLLFTVEYASMNSQTAIGKGVVDKTDDNTTNMSELTGATTLLGNASGMATGTNGLVSVTYRGEENIWGNTWKFTDGMNIYCDASQGIHSLYIADNAFAESKNTDNYKDAGITLATKEGYVSAMAYNEDFDWLFVPAETLGDSALPVGDYFYQNVSSSTGYRVARLGGAWSNGLYGGAFYWYVSYAPSARYRNIGGRLVYVP